VTDYKQPHEDIAGTDRGGDDLLSLDMRAVAHRDALIAVARHLRSACMVGSPAPIVREMSDRMRNPRIGDLVFEPTMATSRRGDLETRIKALGYLIEKRVEWWQTDEEWAADKAADHLADDDRSTDTAWYVQYGPDPADICRWVNCTFEMVPIDPMEFYKPIGSRGPLGVTVTRDDLLSSLADAGFDLRG
jgi:hypothetical protein